MSDGTLTAVATVLLVIVGLAQVFVLISQKRQTRIALIAEYRQIWNEYKDHWGNIIFIGRDVDEYYQVITTERIRVLKNLEDKYANDAPTIWARESSQKIFGFLGEVSTRLLQGHLTVADVYPIFGTELLRQSYPIRRLLESSYSKPYGRYMELNNHVYIRREVQSWLVYHGGLQRRCLILIDLLWAEAVKLEDLPPSDVISAAKAKKETGKLNKERLFNEVINISGFQSIFWALKLRRHLTRAEYASTFNRIGIKEKRLALLYEEWTKRLLNN